MEHYVQIRIRKHPPKWTRSPESWSNDAEISEVLPISIFKIFRFQSTQTHKIEPIESMINNFRNKLWTNQNLCYFTGKLDVKKYWIFKIWGRRNFLSVAKFFERKLQCIFNLPSKNLSAKTIFRFSVMLYISKRNLSAVWTFPLSIINLLKVRLHS